MNENEHEAVLRELHRSLDERWRPEDVARTILPLLDLPINERYTLKRAATAAERNPWSSMVADFDRPTDMSRQLAVAEELFGRKYEFAPDDVRQINTWLAEVEA